MAEENLAGQTGLRREACTLHQMNRDDAAVEERVKASEALEAQHRADREARAQQRGRGASGIGRGLDKRYVEES
jgi:hypothetical protein